MCCRLIKAGQTTLSSSLCSLVYDLQSDLTLSLFLLTICASIMITTLGTYSFMCSLGPLGSTLATLFWCPAAEPNYVNRQTRTNSFSRSVSISKQFSKLLWRTHRGSIHCTALLDFTVTGLMGGRQLAIAASGQSCFYCFTVSRCWGQHVLHCCLNWGLVLRGCVTAQLSLFLAQAIPGDWLAPVRQLCLAFVCLCFSLPRPNTLSVYYQSTFLRFVCRTCSLQTAMIAADLSFAMLCCFSLCFSVCTLHSVQNVLWWLAVD